MPGVSQLAMRVSMPARSLRPFRGQSRLRALARGWLQHALCPGRALSTKPDSLASCRRTRWQGNAVHIMPTFQHLTHGLKQPGFEINRARDPRLPGRASDEVPKAARPGMSGFVGDGRRGRLQFCPTLPRAEDATRFASPEPGTARRERQRRGSPCYGRSWRSRHSGGAREGRQSGSSTAGGRGRHREGRALGPSRRTGPWPALRKGRAGSGRPVSGNLTLVSEPEIRPCASS
jgi:hypothetical protein